MIRAGFSLLEMLVAITIMGLVVGLVAAHAGQAMSSVDKMDVARFQAMTSGHVIVIADSSARQHIILAAYPSGLLVADTIVVDQQPAHSATPTP
jgi:prepilin-type N-terminal cleavage/methylation domain-containing protein